MSDTIDRVASSCIGLVLKGSLHQEEETQDDQRVGRGQGIILVWTLISRTSSKSPWRLVEQPSGN